jgi:NAD(P)H dehydrogenase (quinone)
MRVLVIYAHPCAESFCAAIRDRVLAALQMAGHEARLIDLYAIGFDPVMSAEERRAYHTPGENERPVADHLAALRWAEALVFIYPTWWYGPPAILKGWMERVWVPHAAFRMPEGNKPVSRTLTHIRVIGAISTLGSPRWWWWLIGQPGRRMILTGLGVLCAPRVRSFWLAHYRMDASTPESRAAFLTRVARRMERLGARLTLSSKFHR